MVPAAPPLNDQFMETERAPLATDSQEDLCQWWRHLSSPVLDQLVSQAVYQNFDLREACWRIVEARAKRRSLIGRYRPKGDWLNTRHDRRQSQSGNNILPANAGDSFAVWSTGLDASWELGLFRRMEHLVDAANAKHCAAIEERRNLLVILLAELADEYVRARTYQQQLLVVRDNLALQRHAEQVAKTRWEAGLTSELDAAQAATLAQMTEARISLLEADLQAAVNRICLLMGSPPLGAAEDVLGPGRIPKPPRMLAVGMPADLLRRRPDVRQAQQEAIAESALLGLAEAELLPHLTLTGRLSLDARSFPDIFSARSLAYTLGPTLRWNVLNRGRVKADIQAQCARLQQALIGYERAVVAAAEEADTALNGFCRHRARVEVLRQGQQEANRAATLAMAQYQDGLVSFQGVVDTQQRRLDAADLLKRAEGETIRQLIRVYRAMGGGWEHPPMAPKGLDKLGFNAIGLDSPRQHPLEGVLEVETRDAVDETNETGDSEWVEGLPPLPALAKPVKTLPPPASEGTRQSVPSTPIPMSPLEPTLAPTPELKVDSPTERENELRENELDENGVDENGVDESELDESNGGKSTPAPAPIFVEETIVPLG